MESQGIGDLTLNDVWGRTRTQAPGGDRYFVTFTDGKSQRTMTYFLKQKSEAFEKFKLYRSFVETQTGNKLKKLRADGGGEYLSKDFRNYLLENGIQQETTTPHSSAQNGIAERLNQTLVEHARAMLHHHQLPNSFWKEAVAYATYLKNRSPTRALKDHKVLDEVFWGKKPDVSHLEEFGKKCWVLQQNKEISKLDPKSKQFIFVSIGDGTKGYRYYNPKTHQTLTSRNVIFETQIEKTDEVEVSHTVPIEGESGDNNRKVENGNGKNPKTKTVLYTGTQGKINPNSCSTIIKLSRSKQSSSSRTQGMATSGTNHGGNRPYFHGLHDDRSFIGDDPTSLKEAKARSDWPKWKEAMDAEIDQLTKRGTYKMVDLPPD